MSNGKVTIVTASKEILAADEHRDHVDLQIISGNDTTIAFGEPAVAGTGLLLIDGEYAARFTVTGNRARKQINGINAGTAVIGYDKP